MLEDGPFWNYGEWEAPPEFVAALSAKDKLTYLAKLLRSLAGAYGLPDEPAVHDPELGEVIVGEPVNDSSPAAVLRVLVQWSPSRED